MADLGSTLLKLARNAIASRFDAAAEPPEDLPELHRPGATFVTLTQAGELRGCIGSLEAHRPLGDDVQDNACSAAFRDPRFPPLTARELPITRVEVSLLTPPQPLPVADEKDALSRLRPNIDGLIFSARGRRATFLPQVWEQLPKAADFLAHLRRKAGLPADYWGPDVRLETYQVQKWKEEQP